MKFEYDTKEDNREVVAFVDNTGDLIINLGMSVLILGDSSAEIEDMGTWFSAEDKATKKFYKGDKITITF